MRRLKQFETELDMARIVVNWLSDQHWTVYQEVQVETHGPIADIVATFPPRVCVVECKLSLGLKVIEQASFWTGRAHRVYVAVPIRRDMDFGIDVATRYGLGVLGVSSDHVQELKPAPLFRKAYTKRIVASLTEAHKTFALAGNSNGSRWSPFQATCQAVRNYAARYPGCTLKELIDNIKTHYGTPSTARNCIATYADKGVIQGIRLERMGRIIRVWPT